MEFILAPLPLFAQENPGRLDSILPLLDPARKDTLQLTLLIAMCESWTTSRHAVVGRRFSGALRHALAYDAPAMRMGGSPLKAGVSAWSLTPPASSRSERSIPVGNRAYRSWTCRRACQPAPKTPYALPLKPTASSRSATWPSYCTTTRAIAPMKGSGLLVRACSSRAETNVYHAAMPVVVTDRTTMP